MTVEQGVLLPELMVRLSAELGSLKVKATVLEESFAKALSGRKMSSSDLVAMQDLDLMRQTLLDLTIFTQGLQRQLPDTRIVAGNIFPKILLRDLADRLQGGVSETTQLNEIEVF